MAELIDTMQQIVNNVLKSKGMTDLVIGTVTKDSPLEITIEGTLLPIMSAALLLTESVVQKTITVNGHIHQITSLTHNHSYTDSDDGSISTKNTGDALTASYPTEIAFESLLVTEHGVALPVSGNVVTINRGLAINDKVLMLRVLDGQKFIVLSRLF